ncbi:Transcription termination factor, mitochondrial/chloroplastic [Dillenia turbinata]|uniref:Transcription termination factor, mitochondrial/chloroplastic n=1 Tax=Dillenia turbinata TaxID=194707 RepID=A0AAN8ZRG5_9MAGN
MGFSYKDTTLMIRRFPQLLCYSIKDNFEPKFNYFVVEMGRDLKELREFPQYFSFSLENRIKPRHQCCVEKGVCFPLPIMLKTSDEKFRDRLEMCICSLISHVFIWLLIWGPENELNERIRGFRLALEFKNELVAVSHSKLVSTTFMACSGSLHSQRLTESWTQTCEQLPG